MLEKSKQTIPWFFNKHCNVTKNYYIQRFLILTFRGGGVFLSKNLIKLGILQWLRMNTSLLLQTNHRAIFLFYCAWATSLLLLFHYRYLKIFIHIDKFQIWKQNLIKKRTRYDFNMKKYVVELERFIQVLKTDLTIFFTSNLDTENVKYFSILERKII